MDKERIEKFIDEYIELCKRNGMFLWSGEPWYGLEIIEWDKNTTNENILRKNISYIE